MDLVTTKQMYAHIGQYSAERIRIQEAIMEQLMAGLSPAPDQPQVIFLGGGSGSGKTSISKLLLQSFQENNESVIHVDSDRIKAMLPEHASFMKEDPNTAAYRLHEESSDMAKALFERCLKSRYHILLDGTLKNADSVVNQIRVARENGYGVSLVIADVPLEEALQRAEKRFLIEGRRVPEAIIRESHEKIPVTFDRIHKEVDSCYLYDTSARHPTQFYVRDKSQIQVLNTERLHQFYAKASLKPPVMEHWHEQPLLLKDALKLGKGIPTGRHVTAELLNQRVERFAFGIENGKETFRYQVKGQHAVQRIRMEQPPYLSKQTRDRFLEQAAAPAKSNYLTRSMEM